MVISIGMVLSAAGAISVIGGAILTIQKIASRAEMARKRRKAEILQEAKEDAKTREMGLETRLHELNTKVDTLEKDTQKDISYLKESHNSEMNNLSDKIELLRAQLAEHHAQLLAFLTRLVEK